MRFTLTCLTAAVKIKVKLMLGSAGAAAAASLLVAARCAAPLSELLTELEKMKVLNLGHITSALPARAEMTRAVSAGFQSDGRKSGVGVGGEKVPGACIYIYIGRDACIATTPTHHLPFPWPSRA